MFGTPVDKNAYIAVASQRGAAVESKASVCVESMLPNVSQRMSPAARE